MKNTKDLTNLFLVFAEDEGKQRHVMTMKVWIDATDDLLKFRRKNILDNYFKGGSSINMFPSKHRLEKAIKNINYEMEKASQEFSKLFSYDDKSK